MAKKRAESQIAIRPLKVGNRPDFLAFRWHATYFWKFIDNGYSFVLDLISIGGLHAKLWAPKVAKVLTVGISVLVPWVGTK